MPSERYAREIVLSCVAALNREDYRAARQYLSDDVSFWGVFGSQKGADAYLLDMRTMRLHYEVRKAFCEGEDVCLLYDVTISGATVFVCGWYRVKLGKIRSLRVVFDPRPLLRAKAA
jgi:limonene-1,2-epoxide hydrolase